MSQEWPAIVELVDRCHCARLCDGQARGECQPAVSRGFSARTPWLAAPTSEPDGPVTTGTMPVGVPVRSVAHLARGQASQVGQRSGHPPPLLAPPTGGDWPHILQLPIAHDIKLVRQVDGGAAMHG